MVGLHPAKLKDYHTILVDKFYEEKDNYDNFLNPETIKDLTKIDKQKVDVIRKLKKKSLWKPNRLNLSSLVKNMIASNR